jgi:hypothetical protein
VVEKKKFIIENFKDVLNEILIDYLKILTIDKFEKFKLKSNCTPFIYSGLKTDNHGTEPELCFPEVLIHCFTQFLIYLFLIFFLILKIYLKVYI